MSFMIYDIILLVLFVLFVSVFLYRNKKSLTKEGLLFLYKTSWGMKVIDRVGKKYTKTLKFLSYISITIGYLLMASMLYLFGKIVYMYVAYPNVVRAIKVPPIMPIVPYIDKIAPNLNLPSFYFIYFIIILAIVAIFHEFAHGIFMRRFNIKIKSTGFGFFPFFLPVFLAAFVEQDENSMKKSSKFEQKAVLSAGTFANLLTAILGFGIMVLFFSLAFSPAGVQFDSYAYTAVGIGNITAINGTQLINPNYQSLLDSVNEKGFSELKTEQGEYIISKDFLELQQNNKEYVLVYLHAPAIDANLDGAIYEISGEEIKSIKDLSESLENYSLGDEIEIKTTKGNYEIKLGEHPLNKSKVWLGIFFNEKPKGIVGFFSSFKKPNIYYESNFKAGEFIYDFLWWLVLISFSVALVNMLPMGIFDGGRFFYLTILGITKSEKKAKKCFGFMTYFLLFLVLLLMVFWAMSFL